MDKFRLLYSVTKDGEAVDIFINDKNFLDIIREAELPFAEQEGHPEIAGSYKFLPPDDVYLPSKLLLGEPSSYYTAYNGKIPLLVCGDCGELGCWAFYLRISVEKNTVIWSDYEQSHRGSVWEDNLKSFVFDRKQYEYELSKKDIERKKFGHYVQIIKLPLPKDEAYDLCISSVKQIKKCKIKDRASVLGWINADTSKSRKSKGEHIKLQVRKIDANKSSIEVSSKPINFKEEINFNKNFENVQKIIAFLEKQTKK